MIPEQETAFWTLPTQELPQQGGTGTIHCQHCSLSQLCLPFLLNESELSLLDRIIERKKPVHKKQMLYQAGDELKSLYAIRSGSVKSYTISEQGDEQTTGFYFAGDLLGFDGINTRIHHSFAQALETSMVCEIPFEQLDILSAEIAPLRQQFLRLMSGEIISDQSKIRLLTKKSAEERIASFLHDLSFRFAQRGFSPFEFRLTMTRTDIASYLGLTVETVSRLMGRMQKKEILLIKSKCITILDIDALLQLTGQKTEERQKKTEN